MKGSLQRSPYADTLTHGIVDKKNEILYIHPEEKSCIRKMSFMLCHRDSVQVALEKLERETGEEDIFSKTIPV